METTGSKVVYGAPQPRVFHVSILKRLFALFCLFLSFRQCCAARRTCIVRLSFWVRFRFAFRLCCCFICLICVRVAPCAVARATLSARCVSSSLLSVVISSFQRFRFGRFIPSWLLCMFKTVGGQDTLGPKTPEDCSLPPIFSTATDNSRNPKPRTRGRRNTKGSFNVLQPVGAWGLPFPALTNTNPRTFHRTNLRDSKPSRTWVGFASDPSHFSSNHHSHNSVRQHTLAAKVAPATPARR